MLCPLVAHDAVQRHISHGMCDSTPHATMTSRHHCTASPISLTMSRYAVNALLCRYMALLGDDQPSSSAPHPRAPRSKDWQGTNQGNSRGDKDGDKSNDVDMEVTFASGLEGLGKKALARKASGKHRAGETLFQQYLQRSAEKRKAARARRRGGGGSSDSDGGGDSGSEAGVDDAGGKGAADAFFEDGQGPGEHGPEGDDAGFDDEFFQVCWQNSQ